MNKYYEIRLYSYKTSEISIRYEMDERKNALLKPPPI